MAYKRVFDQCATSVNHMTPEIRLRLLPPTAPLWHQKWERDPAAADSDPFWAFYWPGGQALTRYILDNPATVAGRRVFDMGSGCGASAIAAVRAGAAAAVANDVDADALEAVRFNTRLNGLHEASVATTDQDFLAAGAGDLRRELCTEHDVLLVGDMFFDQPLGTEVVSLVKSFPGLALIGDPGRWFLKSLQER